VSDTIGASPNRHLAAPQRVTQHVAVGLAHLRMHFPAHPLAHLLLRENKCLLPFCITITWAVCKGVLRKFVECLKKLQP